MFSSNSNLALDVPNKTIGKSNYYFSTNGRFSRLEYMTAYLLILGGGVIASLLISLIPRPTPVTPHVMSFFEAWLSILFTVPALSFSSVIGIIVVLCAALVFVLYNNIMIKRLHDMNLSGKWIIIYWAIYIIRLALQYAVFHGYNYRFVNMFIMMLHAIIIVILAFLFIYKGTNQPNKYNIKLPETGLVVHI